jgi:hypothetical protein
MANNQPNQAALEPQTPSDPSTAGEQKPSLDQLLAEKSERLKVLQGEFGALGQQIDGEYLQNLGNVLTPEELETRFDDNPAAFAQAIIAGRERFAAERLGATQQEIDALSKEVASLENQAELQSAKEQFLAAHPEASLDELFAYYGESLTKAQMRAVAAQPDYLSAYEYVYGLMNGGGAKNPKQPAPTEPPLPPSQDLGAGGLNGDPAAVEDGEYYRAIGLR